MKAKIVLITMLMLSIITTREVQAKTSYGADCGSCHNSTSGRFEVTQEDTVMNLNTQLDGNQRGPLKTFVVEAGATVTISANVLNVSGTWYLVVSGLERGGQLNSTSNHLNYQPDGSWTIQGSSTQYFTKRVTSTGTSTFSLTIDAGTPDDIYDVTFGMGGRDGGRLYQEEHFYIQVVSTTAVEPLVLLTPNGGEVLNANDTYQIAWQGGANDDLIWIDCSTDNGASWYSIASGVQNTGSYNWQVPSINTSNAFVNVSTSSDADSSDGPFTISWNPPSPVISGRVTVFESGIPLANVLVSANNNGDSAYTDSSGNYSISVPYDWSGVVTASKADYEFNPSSRTYNNLTSDITNEDYVGVSTIPDVLSIEGIIVTTDSEPIADALISTNDNNISTYSDSSGFYSLTVPYSWSGIVTVSKTDYGFNPASRTYNNLTSNITNENYIGTFEIPDSLVIQGFITKSGSEPIAGVLVWTNDYEDSTYTDSSGYYSLTVPYGWSGVVKPIKADYQFDPPLCAYNNITKDQDDGYIGTNKLNLCPTLSGQILSSSLDPIPGVLVSAGNSGGLAYTDSSGYYSLTVPYGWSGIVTPYKVDYVFDPPLINYNFVTFNTDSNDYIGTGTPSGEFIIDNGDPGTSAVSTWQSQAGGNSYGPNALFNNNHNGSYIYSIPLSGTYELSMWWTNGNEGSGEVTVKVFDGEILLDNLLVDQSSNGGQWNFIGSYDFHNQAKVIIESYGTTALICADAIKLVNTPKPMLPVITIDNGNPGTSSTGQWNITTDGTPYGKNSLYSNSPNSTYSFEALLSGSYEMQIWLPAIDVSSKIVSIEIYDGTTLIDTKFVNQPQNESSWHSLDKYIFLQGTAKVRIIANELNTIVDAVRFIP